MLQLPQPRCQERRRGRGCWWTGAGGMWAEMASYRKRKKSHKPSCSFSPSLPQSVQTWEHPWLYKCLSVLIWMFLWTEQRRISQVNERHAILVGFFFHWNECKLHFPCHKHFVAAGMLFAFVFDFARKRRIQTRELQTTRTDVQNVIYAWKVLF